VQQARFLAIWSHPGHSSMLPPDAIFTDLCKLTPPRQLRAIVPYQPHDFSRELHIDCVVPECSVSLLLQNTRCTSCFSTAGCRPLAMIRS
jgi:hypothetical protein